MYYLSAIFISFIIGLIRRGSIKAIIDHPYKKWVLGFIGLLILIVLNFSYLFTNQIQAFAPYLPILNFVGYLMLLIMFIFNLDDIYSILIALGLTFSFIVTFINGGLLPVAQSVIDIMPANLPLTQSITNATSVIYTIQQPGTLLSFLGVILPIPFFTRYLVMLGTIPGLSVGKTFILVGLLGLVQSAMKLPVEKKFKEERKKTSEIFSEPASQTTNAQRPTSSVGHFDSRTEELFFEENPLPKDPLDKIFAGDMESQETKRLERIKQLRKTKSETDDMIDLDREVEMLTKPLGTGIINSKEIRDRIIRGEQEEVKEEIDGFFSQEFNKNSKVETAEIFTPEETVEETETKIFGESEKEKINQKTEEITGEILTEEIPEKTLPVIVPENISEASEEATTQEEIISEPETAIIALPEETVVESESIEKETEPIVIEQNTPEESPKEGEEIVNISPDIFMTLDQYNSFINSIEDEEFLNEFEYYLKQFRGEPLESKIQEKEQNDQTIISEEPTKPIVLEEKPQSEEKTSEQTKVILDKPEEIESLEEQSEEDEETETKEPEEIQEISEEEQIEESPVLIKVSDEESVNKVEKPNEEDHKEERKEKSKETSLRRRKRKRVSLITDQQPKEKVVIKVLPEKEEPEESIKEKPISEKVETPKVIIRVKEEKQPEESSNEVNSDKIEIQETVPDEAILEANEAMDTTIEEATENSQEITDRLSDIVFEEKNDIPEILTEDINLNIIEELAEPEPYISSKRGEFIQDEGSGYYVNKAYKEEKANMDKSEEEMLNVWAQVSRENQKRKMSRRRRGYGNYGNLDSPFTQEPEVKAQPEKTEPEVKAAPQATVNTMTDEERRAAGYEYVSIDVNGKKLSFWQKKN